MLVIAGALLGSTATAFAAAIPGTKIDDWNWTASKDFPYCFNRGDFPPFVNCEESTLSSVNFRFDISLNGRQANVKTTYSTPFDSKRIIVESWIECRKDERIDDSCGSTKGGGYGFDRQGSYTDPFYLGKDGKYFFNLTSSESDKLRR